MNESNESYPWIELALAQSADIAQRLRHAATQLPGESRKRCLVLAAWFDNKPTVSQMLRSPMALAICNSLSPVDIDREFNSPEIDEAIWKSVGTIELPRNKLSRILGLCLYPMALLCLLVLYAIPFSFYVIKPMEEFYEEFELALPGKTAFLLFVFGFLRDYWIAIVLSSLATFQLVAYFGSKYSPRYGVAILDLWSTSVRSAWGFFSWHVSTLISAGVDRAQAIEIAARSNPSGLIRSVGASHLPALSGSDQTAMPTIMQTRYSLLSSVLTLPRGVSLPALLTEVASSYWARERRIGDWLISWFANALLWFIGGVVLFFAGALFVPLVELISSL